MQHFLRILLVSALLSGCVESDSEQSNSPAEHDHSKHDHGLFELTSLGEEIPKPTLKLNIRKDPMSGWNLQIETSHFRFAPENVNTTNTANEGHAHLFIDDFKIARIYSEWYHLNNLTPGEHRVRVTLNTNTHAEIAYQGEPVVTETTITQP